MDASKGKEEINEQGEVEYKVDTVDYRSPAGENQEPKKENVQVTHQVHDDANSGGVAGEDEKINEQGEVEYNVDTVDYRSPAGENQEPIIQNARVVHQVHGDGNSGGVAAGLADAAGAVKKSVQSAKDAVFYHGKKTPK